MKVPPGRPRIAHRFNVGLASANRVESGRDGRTFALPCRVFFRPAGACPRSPDLPTVETVGYSLAPLRGFADTNAPTTSIIPSAARFTLSARSKPSVSLRVPHEREPNDFVEEFSHIP